MTHWKSIAAAFAGLLIGWFLGHNSWRADLPPPVSTPAVAMIAPMPPPAVPAATDCPPPPVPQAPAPQAAPPVAAQPAPRAQGPRDPLGFLGGRAATHSTAARFRAPTEPAPAGPQPWEKSDEDFEKWWDAPPPPEPPDEAAPDSDSTP